MKAPANIISPARSFARLFSPAIEKQECPSAFNLEREVTEFFDDLREPLLREANRRMLKVVVQAETYFVESQVDITPNPEEQFSSVQRRKRLLAVVNVLPEQDRRCLYLRAEGLRYREIAQVLGISLGGVAFSLAHSLERLGRANGGDYVL